MVYEKLNEELARRRMVAAARKKCVIPATDRTFTSVWVCRDQLNALNDCLKQFTTDEYLQQHLVDLTRDQQLRDERLQAQAQQTSNPSSTQ
ncbi:hypothetical protein CAOG_009396 [Capsaspora owczarzaki ATCC 30864]|uniref:COX assembly mitochondrial protein n=1 Tax=Capsaspora owczarzaki (strain ATCC 30864) TaxID=595528 RepID=A0A0D2U3Q7_CAPO3|nr:hypothetical protein CAOG_009396 [Capsaspora owczarzaki ATCC 30864]